MPLAIQHAPTALPPNTAVALGAFDGFHLGHRALLDRARPLGPRLGVVTFTPHPAEVLAPGRAPPRIATDDQRRRLLAHLGVDHLVLLPFTRQMAALDPEAFATRYLREGLAPHAVVVGASFRFGRGRAGSPADLSRVLRPAGIEVVVVDEVPPPSGCSAASLSSSEIRRRIQAGDVAIARCLLGRPHAVAGPVVAGRRIGRTLGFPTANVAAAGNLLPAPGIYAGALQVLARAAAPAAPGPYPAAVSLGTNPTIAGKGGALVLEAHVLDHDLDLYGAEVEVSFVERLRGEERFDTPEDLVRAIERDVAATRRIVDQQVLREVLPP